MNEKSELVFKLGKFGQLTPVSVDAKGRIKCLCDCGRPSTYSTTNLIGGNAVCCGHSFGGYGNKNACKVKSFGKLTVIEIISKTSLLCSCECGGEIRTRPRSLFLKEATSCLSCKDKRTDHMKEVDDMVTSEYKKDRLTVISREDTKTTRQKAYLIAKCDCGTERVLSLQGLKDLEYGSCWECKPKSNVPPKTTIEAVDTKFFGNWTVKAIDIKDKRYVFCECVCGGSKRIRVDSLLSGDSTSCGCYAKEATRLRFTGKFKVNAVKRHPLYSVYCSMIARCYSEGNTDYPHYGGRGISIDSRWLSPKRDVSGFYRFTADMEDAYAIGLEIERLDVNGNYSPENCTWVCRRSQVNNQRRNRIINYKGINLNVTEWAELMHFIPKLLDDRINHLKWSGDLEELLADSFRDRAHSLLYKGEVRTATYIFEAEGYTDGQRNYSLNKHGNAIDALIDKGVKFEVVKPREKEYLTFSEGLHLLRSKVNKSPFEVHLLTKVDSQLEVIDGF